jgi:hypothetical protein
MAFQVGQRVSVLLQGIHPIAGAGSWTPGIVTGVPPAGTGALVGIAATYSVRIDTAVNGTTDFDNVPEDHMRAV